MPPPAPFAPVKTQLLISDFDESFSDADTDRWIHEVLSLPLRRRFEEIGRSKTMQFTDMCAYLLEELHKEGKTPKDIIEAQQKLYVHPAMVRGVKALKNQNCPKTECFLLSNSNQVYLETVLKVRKRERERLDFMCARALIYCNNPLFAGKWPLCSSI